MDLCNFANMSNPGIIIIVIALYFGALVLISHYSSRNSDNSTFFIGARKMAWPAVALAMITAPISGVTFISVPGMVISKGYSYLQMCLGFIAGYLIIAKLLIPLYYKHRIYSIYSFLEERFGRNAYKTGAWFFLISKILGTAVKFLVVCFVLQTVVFSPLHIPFIVNVVITISLIMLYTINGGVKSVIWADMLKSLVLIISVVLCIGLLMNKLNFSLPEVYDTISAHPLTRILYLDNPAEETFFWKQFLAGMFLVIAMTGLDQDMMQHSLSCRDAGSSRKNLYVSSIMQFIVIALFLALGSLMIVYAEKVEMTMPSKTDDLFAQVAFHSDMPIMVGILFILGLISASYSSVGSALTSLTTSYTVDIMEANKNYAEDKLGILRKKVHVAISILLIALIMGFYYLNNSDAISAVFTLASYTYGPILGLFLFGIFTKKQIQSKYVVIICISAPVLSWIIQLGGNYFFNYKTGFELLLINASLIILGLVLLPSRKEVYDGETNATIAS